MYHFWPMEVQCWSRNYSPSSKLTICPFIAHNIIGWSSQNRTSSCISKNSLTSQLLWLTLPALRQKAMIRPVQSHWSGLFSLDLLKGERTVLMCENKPCFGRQQGREQSQNDLLFAKLKQMKAFLINDRQLAQVEAYRWSLEKAGEKGGQGQVFDSTWDKSSVVV